ADTPFPSSDVSSAVRAMLRNASSDIGSRSTPRTAQASAVRPLRRRSHTARRSFLRARSPVAPSRMKVQGSPALRIVASSWDRARALGWGVTSTGMTAAYYNPAMAWLLALTGDLLGRWFPL